MKKILVISNLFGNNRQGYDLADTLRKQGCRVRLIQFASKSNPRNENFGASYIQPKGPFSKIIVLLNLLFIARRALFFKCDSIVCIGSFLLPLAVLLKIVNKAKLIYYSLEYSCYNGVSRWILENKIDGFIDVEEHRREQMFCIYKLHVPYIVIYNMPLYSDKFYQDGGLRRYCIEKFGLTGRELIFIYAGSYQVYSCLENIEKASRLISDDMAIVFMIPRGLPKEFQINSSRLFLLPVQEGETFYNWLSEADGALLPYESDGDFNVQNCSPQKLFDCYKVGVPYLASSRPLIRKVHSELPEAGRFCDYKSVDSILDGFNALKNLKTVRLSQKMNLLYREKYNYSVYEETIYKFICGE